MAGYDADTSKLVAHGLGVEPCFVTPTWSEQISGHWNDRWDISFASMGITRARMTRLLFTQPYSAEAERFFVRRNSPIKTVQQLAGKQLGGCTGCFAQYYIQRDLDLPGQKVAFLVDHARSSATGSSTMASRTSPTASSRVPLRRRRRRQGDPRGTSPQGGRRRPIRRLLPARRPVVRTERRGVRDPVNTIVRRLQAQGTLRRLSLKYFHTDFARRRGLRRGWTPSEHPVTRSPHAGRAQAAVITPGSKAPERRSAATANAARRAWVEYPVERRRGVRGERDHAPPDVVGDADGRVAQQSDDFPDRRGGGVAVVVWDTRPDAQSAACGEPGLKCHLERSRQVEPSAETRSREAICLGNCCSRRSVDAVRAAISSPLSCSESRLRALPLERRTRVDAAPCACTRSERDAHYARALESFLRRSTGESP